MTNFTKKVKVFTVFTTLAVLVNVVSVSAQVLRPNLNIRNLTNEEITEFIISPSREHFPRNGKAAAFQNLQISNGSISNVDLSGHAYITGFDFFDIEIVAGDNTFTKMGVPIDFSNGKIPTLVLSTMDMDITGELIGAAPNLALAASPLIFTTTKKVARVALLAIPKVGIILFCGALVVEGISIYNRMSGPGQFRVQVYYN